MVQSNINKSKWFNKQEKFIKKAKEIHGDKYDYSKVKYVNNITKICIICPEHGEFWQIPSNHLRGFGCKKCSGMFLDKNTFIERATLKHNGKYDYSKVDYKNNHTKVIIICPEHGEFCQNPSSHLKGVGCPICNGGIKRTQEEFLIKAKEIHGNKYDYSKVKYVNAHTKVIIICPEHGEFLQSPNHHLRGQKCPKCSGAAKSNTDEFIKKAQLIHGNKYDYSETVYITAAKKVKIICPLHGEFYMTGNNHLRGQGCGKCAKSGVKLETSEFIEKAKEIHGDKYDYSKVNYISRKTNICIICPEHGEFWQTPNSHLAGNGCPKCKGWVLSGEDFCEKAKKIHSDKYDYSEVEYNKSCEKVKIICPKHGEFW